MLVFTWLIRSRISPECSWVAQNTSVFSRWSVWTADDQIVSGEVTEGKRYTEGDFKRTTMATPDSSRTRLRLQSA
jgi:hypothetical protein